MLLLRFLEIQELPFIIFILGNKIIFYLYKTSAENSCLFLATWIYFKLKKLFKNIFFIMIKLWEVVWENKTSWLKEM